MIRRRLSSISFWLFIFIAVIVIEGYSAFAQASEVTGSWKTGSVGSVQYRDQVTGATRSGRGSIFTYKFLPNGNYEFIGYMEMNMYNCTTTIFNQINGKYRVGGNTIELDPARDLWKSTNSCAASGNKQQTKPPTTKTLEYRRTTDEYDRQLLCLTDGDAETCYRAEK